MVEIKTSQVLWLEKLEVVRPLGAVPNGEFKRLR